MQARLGKLIYLTDTPGTLQEEYPNMIRWK